MRETNRKGERGEKERERETTDKGNLIDVARTYAFGDAPLRRSSRDNSMLFTGQKKPPRCSFLFYPSPPPHFEPHHLPPALFHPFSFRSIVFLLKRSHLLPSRTHPPMHAHSSRKPSSRGDTKRQEESRWRRGIERYRNWKRKYPPWKHC